VTINRSLLNRLRKDERGVSPAISTTILTCAVVVMLLVTITFANNYLNARIAENEFSAMKQFMQTIGLQIDDVAWIPGRTQTMRYASKYGSVKVQSPALNYSFYKDGSLNASFSVGVILFDMPVSAYSVGNNYFEQIFPSSKSFLQQNASAPVSRLFVVEKLPMQDGSYVRIVIAPIIRQLSSIVNNITYIRLFLPILENGPSPQLSQSVTLTGRDVFHKTISNANNVTIGLSFPNGNGMGLTSDFFSFEKTSEAVNVTPGSVVEIYTGDVIVSLGVHA
jgi:hypothetical protein